MHLQRLIFHRLLRLLDFRWRPNVLAIAHYRGRIIDCSTSFQGHRGPLLDPSFSLGQMLGVYALGLLYLLVQLDVNVSDYFEVLDFLRVCCVVLRLR